jgi:flagellar assembly protein FliH
VAAGLYLEDFARDGAEAEIAHLARQPGFTLLRERLLAEGRAEGRREADAVHAAEREALVAGPLAALERLLSGLTSARAEFQRESERELLALSVGIARRLLRTELRANTQMLAGKLAELLGCFERESSIGVLVNPEDLTAVESLLAAEGRALLDAIPYRLRPDPRLPAGSLVLEGDRARVESIAEDELARLESLLLDGAEDAGAEADPVTSAGDAIHGD